MITNGITEVGFMSALEVKLNADYTDEQKELIRNFGSGPVFCFADPGTGKTFTAIGGLIYAELFKQIPGQSIYALSFTRLATGELSVRHERACRKIGISNQINFKTLHALCRSILKDNYRLLGMSKFDSGGELTMESAYRLVEDSCREWGVVIKPQQITSSIYASRLLNASLIFDQDVVESKMAFKETGLSYETFTRIRGLLFSYSLLSEKISVNDLLLYTVLLLTRHPEISDKFKEKCKLMLVDEAQDLSLLQLRIISLLTDNPVFIGDMKQQIYGFNGACQEVVSEFHKLYPNAKDLRLSQSFRCANEIADYATQIILPNKVGGEDYKGVGDGGKVINMNGLDADGLNLSQLTSNLHDEFLANKNKFTKDYLFLVRNNVSVIPVIEELFKQGLPFRVNKYTPAYEIPVISDLCQLLQLANSPYSKANILALKYIIPEFQGYYTLQEHPFYQICSKTESSIFEVNYQYRDIGTASNAMNVLIEVSEMLKRGATMKDLLNKLWVTYYNNWLSKNAWKLESKPEYYTRAVNSLTSKTFAQFIQDETKKTNIIKECEKYGRGIRCYTMHASKGLEADVVYIIDANQGLIPNTSKLDKMCKRGCEMDAARSIREERSLCYVACTRAKHELYIVSTDKPATMLQGINDYEDFDRLYACYKTSGDDINAFNKFCKEFIPE